MTTLDSIKPITPEGGLNWSKNNKLISDCLQHDENFHFCYFYRSEGQSGITATEPIKVKISEDGARMTRNSYYIIMLFSILQKEEE